MAVTGTTGKSSFSQPSRRRRARAPSRRKLDAWINPPPYTGEAPVYLQRSVCGDAGDRRSSRLGTGAARPLRVLPILSLSLDPAPEVPVGARFQGGSGEYGPFFFIARLTMDSRDVPVDGNLLGQLARSGPLPDNPPIIAFAEPPARTERGAVEIRLHRRRRLWRRQRPRADPTVYEGVGTLAVPCVRHRSAVVVNVHGPKRSPRPSYRDLTGKLFGPSKVSITLEARDGAGQTGVSKPVRFPEAARTHLRQSAGPRAD